MSTPYFRSYWIQQNITELKQYTAAISDLYLSGQAFREQRVLLPKSPDVIPSTADLAPLLRYLPVNTGVYRATAHPTTDQTLDALNDKLLARDPSAYRDQRLAPVADPSIQNPGSLTDLETRIETLPIPQQSVTVALAPFRSLLDSTPLDAMLVYSTTSSTPSGQTVAESLFLPIHTAVILASPTPVDPQSIKTALTEALRPRLTIDSAGLGWHTHQQGSVIWFQLAGLQTIAFAIQDNLCIIASDPETLLQSLNHSQKTAPPSLIATSTAGFNHTAEHVGLTHLTSLLDHATATPQPQGDDRIPAFFSGNMDSLSATFQAVDSETFTQTLNAKPYGSGYTIQQNVLYQWR